jgi:DNA-binding transcriptional MerR regulator
MRYLLTYEVARVLRLTPASVRILERKGRLTAQRTESGTRLFAADDVERLAAERQQQDTPPRAA